MTLVRKAGDRGPLASENSGSAGREETPRPGIYLYTTQRSVRPRRSSGSDGEGRRAPEWRWEVWTDFSTRGGQVCLWQGSCGCARSYNNRHIQTIGSTNDAGSAVRGG